MGFHWSGRTFGPWNHILEVEFVAQTSNGLKKYAGMQGWQCFKTRFKTCVLNPGFFGFFLKKTGFLSPKGSFTRSEKPMRQGFLVFLDGEKLIFVIKNGVSDGFFAHCMTIDANPFILLQKRPMSQFFRGQLEGAPGGRRPPGPSSCHQNLTPSDVFGLKASDRRSFRTLQVPKTAIGRF